MSAHDDHRLPESEGRRTLLLQVLTLLAIVIGDGWTALRFFAG